MDPLQGEDPIAVTLVDAIRRGNLSRRCAGCWPTTPELATRGCRVRALPRRRPQRIPGYTDETPLNVAASPGTRRDVLVA
jgi:hypothetical protein